jgi:hypothetical protein
MGWNVEEVVKSDFIYCPGMLEGTEENFATSNILSSTSVLITSVI